MGFDETAFLTGFPGFIASRLVRQLAKAGARLLLLVQPSFLEQATKELDQIAVSEGRTRDSFRILPGDISEHHLGLTAGDLEILRAESTVVFHLAALYDLAVERELAMKVNVAGTRNVNQIVATLPKLRNYHYVSTCYVAGKRRGRILETELQHEADFRNCLYAPEMHDPDVIIRTSGEQRLSNYLLWQSAYSELVFRPELWPDFTREALEESLAEFARRRRRFGRR